MIDNKVKVTVVSSLCNHYHAGEEIYFSGPLIEKEKSASLCMVAINAIYPFIYAARRGGSIKEELVQCPDCKEKVEFRIELYEK